MCVSPDYVLIPRKAQEGLVEALKEAYDDLFPDGDALHSVSLGSIINDVHFERLKALKERSKAKTVIGGREDGRTKRMEPTVWQDVEKGDSLMEA